LSIIEQAARRLEELRRAGIEVPSVDIVRTPADATAAAKDRPRVPGQPHAERDTAPGAASRPASSAATSKTAHINLDRLAAMGYLTPDRARTKVAEEFRIVKRPLLKNLRNDGDAQIERANLIMVTSSLPGEGKTFVSVNLAISIAMELDKHVLLVDADVARPSVMSRLGLEPSKGLLDILTDTSVALSDALLRTNIDKLTLLPAGAPNRRATEVLASESMSALLDDMVTASSCSTRRRCCRRQSRACWRPTWARSSLLSRLTTRRRSWWLNPSRRSRRARS
jgi:protein-tyrosine kinase